MFGRNKDAETEQVEGPIREARDGAKNRPTPKRRDQEAANRKPLIVTDRKAARARDKEARREAYAKARAGQLAGDERYLGPRDKGPRRRFIRDSVDARRNLGEYLLPIMVLVLVLSFVAQMGQGNPTLLLVVFLSVYLVLALAILDAFLAWRRIKKQVIAKFGQTEKGDAFYAIMRAFQMRRTRMPKPTVERGQYPS